MTVPQSAEGALGRIARRQISRSSLGYFGIRHTKRIMRCSTCLESRMFIVSRAHIRPSPPLAEPARGSRLAGARRDRERGRVRATPPDAGRTATGFVSTVKKLCALQMVNKTNGEIPYCTFDTALRRRAPRRAPARRRCRVAYVRCVRPVRTPPGNTGPPSQPSRSTGLHWSLSQSRNAPPSIHAGAPTVARPIRSPVLCPQR